MKEFPLSDFAQRLGPNSGIIELMDDLGQAMASGDQLMMGGGNPAIIPEVVETFRERMRSLTETEAFDKIISVYEPPQGNRTTLTALAKLLRDQFGWEIGPENLAVTGGGQTAFFLLFNMLAGSGKKILFPLAPEYIGYANQATSPDMFTTAPPKVEYDDDGFFKYGIDFDRLTIDDSIAAICVSRPTNPTGNVLTDEEMQRLAALAETHAIPLIIDNAYGLPFPNIIFQDVTPVWTENTIVTMSLSKLGLPGTRTAFVAGPPSLIKRLAGANCILSLANNNLGQALIQSFFEDQSILNLCQDIIRPHYHARAMKAVDQLRAAFAAHKTPIEIHRPEGALFLWVRFPGLPITSKELYERLKARRLLVIPGHYFFFGLTEAHPHEHECLRLTYSQEESVVRQGITILEEEVRRAYAETS